MRYLKYLYMLIGVALLGVIVTETDLAEATTRVMQFGWGAAVVLAIYLVTFSIDSLTWLITLRTTPITLGWFYRLWQARLVGEAFNMTVPAAGMGGEPVKAVLLKQRYGIGYREGAASLFMSKTVNMLGLVVFLAAGFLLMLRHGAIPGIYVVAGGLGLAAFTTASLIFFSIQRFRMLSAVTGRLGRWRVLRRLTAGLENIREVESHFVGFYSGNRKRFVAAVALGILSWVIGVLEVYYALEFLGYPVSLSEAWIIEAMAQMVRTGSFFVPASIGWQDGAFVLICGAITGSPELGIAVALVRRMREIVWVVGGFALGSLFHLSRAPGSATALNAAETSEDG